MEGNYLLKHDIDHNNNAITLVYGGATLNELQQSNIKGKGENFGLLNTEIIFKQGLSFDVIDSKKGEVENLKAEMNRLNLVLKRKENIMDSIAQTRLLGKGILDEIKHLYPQIVTCSYAETFVFTDSLPNSKSMGIVEFTTKDTNLSKAEKDKIYKWLKTRLNKEKIKVYYEVNTGKAQ
ncbi:MAG: hypothetical protein H0X62_09270 [Bacteroidetes bacterium]|nr:hypothetical protein [Bacteroidota bacterium]